MGNYKNQLNKAPRTAFEAPANKQEFKGVYFRKSLRPFTPKDRVRTNRDPIATNNMIYFTELNVEKLKNLKPGRIVHKLFISKDYETQKVKGHATPEQEQDVLNKLSTALYEMQRLGMTLEYSLQEFSDKDELSVGKNWIWTNNPMGWTKKEYAEASRSEGNVSNSSKSIGSGDNYSGNYQGGSGQSTNTTPPSTTDFNDEEINDDIPF
tara:strand:+ start:114 stop:740 length:627 start_codon:yes stop_codon:yes gene_type:complete